MWGRKNWNRLNQMLDEGIRGEFQESHYDESELSRLESKWKQFLAASAISRENLEKEKDNIKGLISDISHQTKTPIANIRLYAELLEERLSTGENIQETEMIRQIQKQAEKLEFLIQSLTKMSRLETNILEVCPARQPVSGLMHKVQEEILPKAQGKDIRVLVDDEVDFHACFDMKWTSEALYNLADNAVKYSPAGSEIRIFAKEYEIYGSICIMDRGMGISEEEIPKIFGRFYRSPGVQQEEGVGIGLYLAREILRKENGYIKVTSRPGEGSTFAAYLPKNKNS